MQKVSRYVTKNDVANTEARVGTQNKAECSVEAGRQAGSQSVIQSVSQTDRQTDRHASASFLLSRNMDSTDHVDLPLCCVSVPRVTQKYHVAFLANGSNEEADVTH